MKYSIAAVSFLNTIPLVEQLAASCGGQVELQLAMPSRLSGLLESGAADVALVPIVEVFRGCAAGIVGHTGIACQGPVDSVKLFFKGPISSLETIQADRGSRTSVALLEVLLKEVHGLSPNWHEVEPIPGVLPAEGEGILVIGDRCFEFERYLRDAGITEVESWDLGAGWRDFTGLPFVFAAWAVSREFYAKSSADEMKAVTQLLLRARDYGLQRLDTIAAREAANGRLGHKGEATTEAIDYYFRESLTYRLGESEMAGIARFHELCVKHGVVPDKPVPLILRG